MAPALRARNSAALGRALAGLAAVLLLTLALPPAVAADTGLTPTTVQPLCGPPAPGRATCHALVRSGMPPTSRPLAASTPSAITPSPFGALDLQEAYGLTAAAAALGAGVKVAVVDAYDDPTAEADLAGYRSSMGLPPCTSASGCFTKVDQNGGTAYPALESGWAAEIALDLEMVSAICPNCSIALVEARSEEISDLGIALNRAVTLGATFIANSYGTFESPSELTWDAEWYTHPGVVITVSAGDFGYGVQFPASSPHVVSVGGTTLARSGGTWVQSAWSGAGSGCSAYEPKPSWQTDTGCSKRTVADVSAIADPSPGVAVYHNGYWYAMGGTSAAAPIVAAAYALAGRPATGTYPVSYPYLRGGLTDVVGGSNGTCAIAYLCQGVSGYDGPTGLGTPSGTTPFTKPGAPSQPTGVGALPGSASATVSWAPPASDGGAPITKYTATANPGGGTCTWSSGPFTCTIAGLTNGQEYTFTVTATNASGTGPPSSPSPPVTVRGVPGQPQSVSGLPGDGSVTASWSAPSSDGGSPLIGYTATATPGGGTCAAPPSMTRCTVIGLANGQGYTLSVTAVNAVGTGRPSAPSATITPRTVPGAPMGVQALPGNASAQVAWSPPPLDGGAAITGYTVTSWPGGHTCAWSSGPLVCTVSGLTNGQTYRFSVVAANAAGSGYVSGSSAFVTLPTPPAPPAGVTATLPATPMPGSLDVTWTAVGSAGSPVTGYTATAYLAGTSTSTGRTCTVTGAPPSTWCTITGLTPGIAVVARVAATTAAGTGQPSNPSAPVTPPTPPSASVGSLPTWTVAAALEVPLSGSPGANAIATYEVRFRRALWNGSFGSYGVLSTTTPSVSLAVSAGATYCFSARARDDQGYASPAWSAERCTAVPLDDRSLSAQGTWGRGTGSTYYRATWTRSYAYGAALVRTSVQAKRIAIVATTCPTCGSVRVYLGSTLLRSISLTSSTTLNRKVITVANFSSVRSGTLTVKVSTSRRMVRIDGLAISRS